MLPLHQRGIGAAGVEPACTFTLSAPYKGEGIRPSWRPGGRTLHYRFIRTASSPAESSPAEDGGVEPHGLATATGVQSPLPRRRRVFPERRAAVPTRSGHPPTRFRDGACHLAGSLSMSVRPMDVLDVIGGGLRMVDGSNVRGPLRPDLRFPAGHLTSRSTIQGGA